MSDSVIQHGTSVKQLASSATKRASDTIKEGLVRLIHARLASLHLPSKGIHVKCRLLFASRMGYTMERRSSRVHACRIRDSMECSQLIERISFYVCYG